ncbi:MAG TPA: glycosyltransferase [Bacteroidales bacterium]|nr:glycosyltransferase [Bacteroidales bacterium]
MKVLSILPSPSTPSALIFSRRQIGDLEKLGLSNETFFIPSRGLGLRLLLRTVRDLRKTIRRFDPDLLHVHYGVIFSFIAAVSNCRPLIITFQGSDINTVRSRGVFRNIYGLTLSNLSLLRAGKVICVSQNLLKNFWWGRSKVVIIPPGINLEKFRPKDKKECRRSLHWKEEEKIILFNGNNPSVKRLDLALATLERLKEKVPGARLEVLDGTLPDEEKIPLMLNGSDGLLICSDSEGSPTMVKEALACNVPVVGVEVGDVAERLEGVARCRVVAKDPESLAQALEEMLASEGPAGGRDKLIADGLSDEMVAKRIYNVYKELIPRC